jgi:hypothetical protein
MVYRGRVKNGVIVLDEPGKLKEGQPVSVRLLRQRTRPTGKKKSRPTLADVLGDLIGSVKGLPSDLSLNHDHYLYGTPKRK